MHMTYPRRHRASFTKKEGHIISKRASWTRKSQRVYWWCHKPWTERWQRTRGSQWDIPGSSRQVSIGNESNRPPDKQVGRVKKRGVARDDPLQQCRLSASQIPGQTRQHCSYQEALSPSESSILGKYYLPPHLTWWALDSDWFPRGRSFRTSSYQQRYYTASLPSLKARMMASYTWSYMFKTYCNETLWLLGPTDMSQDKYWYYFWHPSKNASLIS